MLISFYYHNNIFIYVSAVYYALKNFVLSKIRSIFESILKFRYACVQMKVLYSCKNCPNINY